MNQTGGAMSPGRLSEVVAVLRCHPAFRDVSEPILARLARTAVTRRYAKNEIIFNAGDRSEMMFVVESGRVLVYKDTPSGKSFTFVVATRGLTLNAVTCFKARPRFFSAAATEETSLIAFPCADFVTWAFAHQEAGLEVIDIMAHLLDSAYCRITELIDDSVEQRIINTLTRLTDRLGPELELTNTELADLTGSTRETAARVVSRLQEAGLLTKSRGRIDILDQARLTELTTGRVFLI